ncbi:tyrosine-type recombinase/integrase [Rhodopirellula sp. SWK7]|uniref:tyrosine-type recombinase/integrase n=1 Tax=Rhodopirellula sp. SWK7 TaxID=595460 RepID=UPI0007C4980D|nr:tyrosine-type recombinase/integrase [Rhodopirellula sp. SWK7]
MSVHKASGLWCRVRKGKRYYFERVVDDPEGTKSLDQWLEILAGREPKRSGGDLSLKDLCNHWMDHKKAKLDAGDLVQDTYNEYFHACELVMESINKELEVDRIQPSDFSRLRAKLAKRFGPVTLGKHIGQIRSLFNFGKKAGLLEREVNFGLDFEKPAAKRLRKQRALRGQQDFTAAEIKQLLAKANTNWRAMILLGVQAGFGNRDVAELTEAVIDFSTGWIDYPREKTAVARRVPLWPETVEALRNALNQHPGGSKYLFVGDRGRDYTSEKHTGNNRITGAFKPVLKAAGFPETGRGFYCLRRTFQTQAEECGDLVAVKSIMGHTPSENDMSARYRQRVSDQRLKRCVDTVHDWLFKQESDHE